VGDGRLLELEVGVFVTVGACPVRVELALEVAIKLEVIVLLELLVPMPVLAGGDNMAWLLRG